MKRSTLTYAFAALAIAFFFGPVALRVVGVKPDDFENRALATRPKLSQGWNAFDQMGRFVTDHIPLRHQAVRANTWIYTDLLGTTPRNGRQAAANAGLPFGKPAGAESADAGKRGNAAQAVEAAVGTDGWLYVASDFQWPCAHTTSVAMAIARWRELLGIVRAAGKRSVLFVAPDKGTIYPAHFPAGPVKRCGVRGKRVFNRQLGALPPAAGILDLAGPILAARARSRYPLYSKTDTHWNSLGALVMARAVVRMLGGGIRIEASDLTPVRRAPILGGLAKLQGRTDMENVPSIGIRPGRPARKIGGRVLLIGDSFRGAPFFLLASYFRHLDLVDIRDPQTKVVGAIAAADAVVFVNVERGFTLNGSDEGAVTSGLLAALRARLARR